MEPIFTGVMNGESVNTEDSCVFVDREGYTEVYERAIVLTPRKRILHGR